MIKPVHCLVVRHALPAKEPKDNPGISPSALAKIDSVGWALSTVFEDEGIHEAMIFCSPLRRALETAERLRNTDSLRRYVTGDVQQVPELDESQFDRMDIHEKSMAWTPILSKLASIALTASNVVEVPSLILVTHKPVINSIPFLRYPNTNPLSINEFKTNVQIL